MSDARANSTFRRPNLSINKLGVSTPAIAPVVVAQQPADAVQDSFPVALPAPVPTAVANADPVANAVEQLAPRNAAFVVARTYEGRIAPAKPWTARIQLAEASRVGIQVSAGVDAADVMVSFTGTRGKMSGRPLFAPVSAPPSDQPSWFRVPAGVVQLNVGFRGNEAHHASVTIWLPTEVAGIPANRDEPNAA